MPHIFDTPWSTQTSVSHRGRRARWTSLGTSAGLVASAFLAANFTPVQAANVDNATSVTSDVALKAEADGLLRSRLAWLPIEVLDMQHRMQVLPTLRAVVRRLAGQKVYCRNQIIDETLTNIRCRQTDPNQGVPDFALLTKEENGRLLIVSVFDRNGDSISGKSALELLYLAATGDVAPDSVTATPARMEDTYLGSPPTASTSTDRCLWSEVHKVKAKMGTIWQLDAFIRQIGGQCLLDESKGGDITLACQFPDAATHRNHVLELTGENDDADCYGITRIQLNGRPLPFSQYVQIFIDHK